MATVLKRGHKELSLEKKVEFITASEAVPKPKQADLSIQFGIGRSTVSDILRKRDQYMKSWESNCAEKRQRIVKVTPLESLNKLLYSFFSQARAKKMSQSAGLFCKVKL